MDWGAKVPEIGFSKLTAECEANVGARAAALQSRHDYMCVACRNPVEKSL